MSNLKSSLTVSLNDQVSRKARSISKQFERMRKAIINSGNDFKISERIDEASDRMKLMTGSIDGAVASMMRLKRASNEAGGRATKAIADFRLGLDKAAKRVDLAANLHHASEGMGRVARGLRNALAGPIQATIEFDDQMRRVGALIGSKIPGDMARLSGAARQLGAATWASASQAAEGMQYLAQQGFSVQQILDAMPQVLALASANAVDLGRAAEIAGITMRQFGLETDSLERITDVLTATASGSNASLESLGESMKYVAPVARQAGISIEQTAAMAGLLANAGIGGSQAGTALRAMFDRMANPAGEARKAIQSVGLSLQDIKVSDFIGSLGKVLKATEKLSTDERLKKISQIFGQEAMSGAAVLLQEKGAGSIEKFVASYADMAGITKRQSAEIESGIGGAAREGQSAIEELSLTIGEKLIPALSPLIRKVTDMANGFSEWANENPEMIESIGNVVLAVAGITTIVGPVVGAIGAMVTAYSGLKVAIGAVGVANSVVFGKFSAITALVGKAAFAIGAYAAFAYAAYKFGGWLGEKLAGDHQDRVFTNREDLARYRAQMAGKKAVDAATPKKPNTDAAALEIPEMPVIQPQKVGGELKISISTDAGAVAKVASMRALKGTSLETSIDNGASVRSY